MPRHPDPQLPRAEGVPARRTRLTGVVFEKVKPRTTSAAARLVPTGEPTRASMRRRVIAVGRENAFPWIEGTSGSIRQVGMQDRPGHLQSSRRSLSAGTRARTEEHPGRGPATMRRSPSTASATAGHPRPPAPHVNLLSQRWASTSGLRHQVAPRRASGAAEGLTIALRDIRQEVELDSTWSSPGRRRSAASTATCRRSSRRSCASSATPAWTSARWTACLHPQRRGGGCARANAPARNPTRRSTCRPSFHRRIMQGRGRVPALRAVRRALPDGSLGHAEIPARHDERWPTRPREGEGYGVITCVITRKGAVVT